ncbi:hypothetical protein Godav_002802 [Gossypium davidsonii]|uniref:Uncharacterized protein n=1 Tax=Gossypium davidsonii TaxID=34287 RepID=A0A7J8SX92_GOSDV|nr:hypothetical protein [Gossypium davidsonii]
MIEKLQEEKIQLKLDVDIQKLKDEKVRKEKNKAEKNLDTVQADMLSLRYELELGRGRELAWRLRKVKALSVKARPYIILVLLKTHATSVPKMV